MINPVKYQQTRDIWWQRMKRFCTLFYQIKPCVHFKDMFEETREETPEIERHWSNTSRSLSRSPGGRWSSEARSERSSVSSAEFSSDLNRGRLVSSSSTVSPGGIVPRLAMQEEKGSEPR